jgi:RNA polymerase sigma-70 factor (ECF subfamily)
MHRINKNKIDETTVKRFVYGDMNAFDAIYSFFSPKLQKFVFSLIKTEDDTEDVVHEVFVKIWENKEKLKNHASFDSYLFSTAYNTTISFLRSKAKDAKYIEYVNLVQVEIEEPDSNDWLNSHEFYDRLNSLIEEMPLRQREVFKMRHFQKNSYKEIAEALNISVNTVENHIVKANRYIKGNFGKNYLAILLFLYLFF